MISAKLNNLRISPRKVRLVTDLIRGLSVFEAQRQLNFLSKRSADPVLKLLNSSLANAKNNAKIADGENLVISKIFVNGGPVLKRQMPRAFGRAFIIRKRTSHITIILEEKIVDGGKLKSKPVRSGKGKEKAAGKK